MLLRNNSETLTVCLNGEGYRMRGKKRRAWRAAARALGARGPPAAPVREKEAVLVVARAGRRLN